MIEIKVFLRFIFSLFKHFIKKIDEKLVRKKKWLNIITWWCTRKQNNKIKQIRIRAFRLVKYRKIIINVKILRKAGRNQKLFLLII